MKKSDKIILIIYILIGAVLIVTGLQIHIDYYSSLIFTMGLALSFSSILQFIRYYRNTRPENIDAYREKLRQQSIDLKDERKVQIRNRAGYITWAATMILCFIAAFIAGLLHAPRYIILSLAGAAVLEYAAATIIYKYLSNKM